MWGQILETFRLFYGSRGGPGFLSTGVGEGDRVVLAPGGEDIQEGGNSTLAPAGLTAKHQWNSGQQTGSISTSRTVHSRLDKSGGHK